MKKFSTVLLTAFLVTVVTVAGHAQLISVKIQPAPPVYERPAPPSPRHVWVDGEWNWQNGRYVWQPGFWTIPEPYKVWVKGYWQERSSGWHWVPGHWVITDQRIGVDAQPAPIIEKRPPAPSARHVWVDGEWVWTANNYTWKPGYWIVPEAHKKWIKGYWHQRPNGKWFWISGHWIEF